MRRRLAGTAGKHGPDSHAEFLPSRGNQAPGIRRHNERRWYFYPILQRRLTRFGEVKGRGRSNRGAGRGLESAVGLTAPCGSLGPCTGGVSVMSTLGPVKQTARCPLQEGKPRAWPLPLSAQCPSRATLPQQPVPLSPGPPAPATAGTTHHSSASPLGCGPEVPSWGPALPSWAPPWLCWSSEACPPALLGSLYPLSTWLHKSPNMPSAIRFPAWTHSLGTAWQAPSASSTCPMGRAQRFQPSHSDSWSVVPGLRGHPHAPQQTR